jgi:hypothetical protein
MLATAFAGCGHPAALARGNNGQKGEQRPRASVHANRLHQESRVDALSPVNDLT